MTSPEWRAARDAALANSFNGHDEFESTLPCGHEKGLQVCTRLTTDYRNTYRTESMDVKPQEVVDCLNAAGVTGWCLMGLHGYVGYLPQPRATQDVDVMVPQNQKKKAIRAVRSRWPQLQQQDFSVVVRFVDPGELDRDGNPVPVIDLMLPFGRFQETILRDHVINEHSGSRIPTAEAAIVSKYAALVSPHRKFGKKQLDAADLGNLIRTLHPDYRVDVIQSLADEVWEGGGSEILQFIDCALNEQPFPV